MVVIAACAGDPGSVAPAPDIGEVVPCPSVEPLAPGLHRLYLQGAGGEQDADGRFPLLTDRRHVIEGDHFIMNTGSYVEFALPLSATVSGDVSVHIARDDDEGVIADYALVHLSDGLETQVGGLEDAQPGNKGRTPYDGVIHAETIQPQSCHDQLLLRLTNRTGGTLGIVVVPPDYMCWIDVTVPGS